MIIHGKIKIRGYKSTCVILYEALQNQHSNSEPVFHFLYIAPSPPRSVRGRLVSAQQSLIEVSWREPAATNGIITQYTLSVTSSGRGSTNDGNDGIAVNQVEAFNRASAKFCAIRYYCRSGYLRW